LNGLKMPSASNKKNLIVIVGPTAVGKTEISIDLAMDLHGEIISADSRLFYRGMDIGTAKPTLNERKGVPHHLIDIAEPDEKWSLALFQQTAYRLISEIQQKDRLPFLVGGTGQYVRAVVEGWAPPSLTPNHRLRTALEKWTEEIGADSLHEKLAVLDPQAAMIIDARNVRRTIRALEVIFGTGKRFSEQRTKSTSPFGVLMIGLTRPRQELYQRIDQRIDRMIREGFVDEVKSLLSKGYSPDLPSLSAIGYREVIAFLQGKISLEEAKILMRRQTRQFVRRQANWFKPRDPLIHWFDLSVCGAGEIQDFILEKNRL
jgi:tRNA dimethylallyltransferase